ncbi:MAG: response regulator [Paracoccus sp. (in: a-proteobacteria)]|nr:response regulator [Paracoccus sp. (in: a-proteobacteria)]
MQDLPLSGRTILVVEDDFFQAQDLSDELREQGATLMGPFSTLAAAEAALSAPGEAPDAAILDIKIRNLLIYPLAQALDEAGIPYLFATGYDQSSVPHGFHHAPICEKPFQVRSIVSALCNLCEPALVE